MSRMFIITMDNVDRYGAAYNHEDVANVLNDGKIFTGVSVVEMETAGECPD